MFMEKVICGALVAGMLAQCPQSIYAEDAANTATVTDTESKNHVTPDTTQQPDDTKNSREISSSRTISNSRKNCHSLLPWRDCIQQNREKQRYIWNGKKAAMPLPM